MCIAEKLPPCSLKEMFKIQADDLSTPYPLLRSEPVILTW